MTHQPSEEAIALLKNLISITSFSKMEDKTADAIEAYLKQKKVKTQRLKNNIWAKNKFFDLGKPTILLNSHHDTVQPNTQYTKNPFQPIVEDAKLFGLGSNDAGGALVSLMQCFLYFYERTDLNFNLIYTATAEEEISGLDGVEIVLPHLGNIDLGIVGEPTQMNIAIAEKGLFVIDCVAHGISGHAAREEGDNAIYQAMKDIEWFRNYEFPKVSETLGKVKMTVTVINAGNQHNVVPDTCHFTVDIRTTDEYSNKDVLEEIKRHVKCDVQPRSFRLNSSFVSKEHPLVKIGAEMGRKLYGSPTSSDQALMNFPTFKMGPGDSSRSHTADEYIYLHEIETGIALYIKMLEHYNEVINNH